MSEDEEIKEWVKFSYAPRNCSATVSLVQGNHSARWTVKAYAGGIKAAVKEARKAAHAALGELREAIQELDAEEAA